LPQPALDGHAVRAVGEQLRRCWFRSASKSVALFARTV
jgi:hypothetical protein